VTARWLVLLLAATAAAGCSTAPPTPDREPTAAPPPRAVVPTPPAPGAPPATPTPPLATPPASATRPPASPPQVSPRIPNEDLATRTVTTSLQRTNQLVERIEPARLVREQREMLSSVQDFVAKAFEALQARDVPKAQILAEKASKLADELALALRISR
jgi:hypothetical protein